MGKKKRTKTIEFTVHIPTAMEQLEGHAEMMAEFLNIRPDETPEEIVKRIGCSLEYSGNLLNTPFLLKKGSNDSAVIIMAPTYDKRDARFIAAKAMLYASSSILEENKDSVYHTLKKGETCHPTTQNENEFLRFMARHILMQKSKIIESIDMHLKGTEINMRAVAADFNVRPELAVERAAELGFIKTGKQK